MKSFQCTAYKRFEDYSHCRILGSATRVCLLLLVVHFNVHLLIFDANNLLKWNYVYCLHRLHWLDVWEVVRSVVNKQKTAKNNHYIYYQMITICFRKRERCLSGTCAIMNKYWNIFPFENSSLGLSSVRISCRSKYLNMFVHVKYMCTVVDICWNIFIFEEK